MTKLLPKLLLIVTLTIIGSSNLHSQTVDANNWMAPMLEPNPNYYKAKAAFDTFWKGTVPDKGFGYKVFKRWEHRVKDRLDSNGNVIWSKDQLNDLISANNGGGLQGNDKVIGGTTSVSACPALGRWEPVGPSKHPYNQSTQPTGVGRVAGIAFHPTDSNTFYALAPQGGVWKTTNNGSTWKHIFGNGPIVNTIGVSCMLISYNNTDTLYIGTGDRDGGDAPGLGVLMSPNGGTNWYTRNSGISGLIINKMVMDPKNSKIIIAATNGGIYRTTDGGSSWTSVNSSGSFTDIVFHPYNRQYLYAVRAGLFYRSTNNGTSWTQITSGLPSPSQRGQIAVSKANRGYVYLVTSISSYFQGVYRSTDSGTTFTNRSTTPNILGYYDGTSGTSDLTNGQGWYDLDIAVDKKDAETVYVGGVNIWKSTNGGTSWTQVAHWYGGYSADDVHADQHATEVAEVGEKLFSGNDGGIYYSLNKGKTWVNITDGIQNSQIYRISHAKSDEFISATGYQDNGSAQTARDEFITYYGGDGMDCQVDPSDASYVYGSYVYGRIYRSVSKDNGTTIGVNGTGGITESGDWLTPFVLREGSPSTMFAGYINVWRNTNVKSGAPTWTSITSGWGTTYVASLESSIADNKILFAIGNNNKLHRTTDATVASPAWTDLSGSQPSGIKMVESRPKLKNIIYAVNSSALYKSTNMGASWSTIGTVPSGNGNLNCLYFDTSSKTETIYIGTEKGVLVWDSVAGSIQTFNTNFPIWSDVTDLDMYYAKDRKNNKLIASTYGRGVWKTNCYEDGNSVPKSDFYAFDTVFVVGGTMKLYEKIQNSASSVQWTVTPYSYSYVNGTDSTSLIPNIKFTAAGVYHVSLKATNCQGNNTKTRNNWVRVFPAPVAANCKSTTTFGTTNAGLGIKIFSFSDNISETGGYFDDGEYIDRSNDKIFRIKPSTTYTFSVKTGYYNSENMAIFIDYNNNGKFDNYLSERVSTSSGSAARTFTYTTPSTIKKNIGMRLRVMADFNSLDTNACRNLTYSQSEDYSLVYDKTTPYFKASLLTACTGQNITFTDTSEGYIGTYAWDFGSGASPATAVGKGPHIVTYSTAGTKNVKLKINANDSLVKTSYITVNTSITTNIRIKSGTNPLCAGQNITLAAKATSGTVTGFQWLKNGSPISGKTDSLLTFTGIATTDAGTYSCVLSNSICSATTTTIGVSVNPKPVPAFSINSTPQCLKYNNFSFTNTSTIASGSATSKWTMGDGNTQTTTNATRKYAATGTYSVKLVQTSNNSCKDSVTQTVTVNAMPNLAFSINTTPQCLKNNSFVFTNSSSISSGSLTYTWQYGDGGTSSATSPTYSYTAASTYTVRLIGNSNNSCKDSLTKTAVVNVSPVPDFTINSSAQCLKGNSFVYTNTTTNGNTYAWNFGNSTAATTTNGTAKYSSAGTYTVKLVATNSNGCKDSVNKTVTVNPQATPAFSINNATQCLAGNSFTYTNSSSISSGTLTYNWNFGDGGTSTSTSPTYSYSSASTFSVMLVSTSNNSCKDTLTKSVTVNASPTMGFSINNAAQCLKGNSFTYTNTTTGATSYLWRLGNGNTSTSTNSSASYSAYGSYNVRLIATASNGCKDSITKSVTVHPKATVAFSINNATQCLTGNSFTFTNSSSIPTGSISNNDWAFGNGGTSTNTSPTYTYPSFGVYSVRLITTSNNGCKDTLSKSVTVNASPTAGFNINNANQCLKGNTFTYTSTSTIGTGTMSYTWTSNASAKTGTPVSYVYPTFGSYSIKLLVTSNNNCKDSITKTATVYPQATLKFAANDTDQCEVGNSFTFTSTSTVPAGSISSNNWNMGDLTTKTGNPITYTYAEPGTYNVKLFTTTNNSCKDTLTKTMLVYETPISSFFVMGKNDQCLKGNAFKLGNHASSSDPIVLYEWTYGNGGTSTFPQPTIVYGAAGSYRIHLKVTTNKGCTADSFEDVVVYPQNAPSFTVNTLSQCENENQFNFTNTTSALTGTTYEWQYADGNTATTTQGANKYAVFGNYNVLLITKTNKGCLDTASKTVTVWASPVAGFNINNDAQCFKNHQFEFENGTELDAGTQTFVWSLGDNTSSTNTDVIKKYSQYGVYNVKLVATSNFGCKDSITQTVTAHPDPILGFNWQPTTICENERIFIQNSSTVAKGSMTHFWNFGNGNTKSGDTGSAAYSLFGSYTIKLLSTTDKNCKDSLSKPLTILSIPVPNFTATPNPACPLQSTVTFANSSNNPDANAVTYDWTFGDASTSTLTAPTHIYTTSGNFNAVLTVSNNKCKKSTAQTVVIAPKVSALFAFERIGKERIKFTALDTNVAGYSYKWTFGDDSSAQGKKVTHYYKSNDTFKTTLIVKNEAVGCNDTFSGDFKILSPLFYNINNKFNYYVFPNPTNGKFVYKFVSDANKKVTVKLWDVVGQVPIYERTWSTKTSDTYFDELDLKAMGVSAGTYPLTIESEGQHIALKIVYVP